MLCLLTYLRWAERVSRGFRSMLEDERTIRDKASQHSANIFIHNPLDLGNGSNDALHAQ